MPRSGSITEWPPFYLNGYLVWFAGYAKHIGFYPGEKAISRFAAELSGYKHAVGSVQFPLDAELPADLVSRIVEFRIAENRSEA